MKTFLTELPSQHKQGNELNFKKSKSLKNLNCGKWKLAP